MTTGDVRAVLFDLDGTLIDSERLILASYRHTMQEHLDHVPPEETWKATIGQPLVVQMKMFADRPDQVEAMIQTYVDHNLSNHDSYVRPFAGVRSVLQAIRRSGRVLGIVTSKKRRATHMGLERCDLPAEWFAAIVTADDVERYKPEPDPVLSALRQAGVGASKAMFVGDSTHDMRSGRAAGVVTAAALWGPYSRAQLEPTEPDLWLEAPGDLLPALGLTSGD
ncbi:MAG: HAD-IA family hydrolase [Gemmatimonadetes bacterium]|nr:HAD-IA family hydrolase [Gemmatimonadota bacterium]NNK47781.1 HAD-IA family hydrolase [Gemmatimonadota bacterium]